MGRYGEIEEVVPAWGRVSDGVMAPRPEEEESREKGWGRRRESRQRGERERGERREERGERREGREEERERERESERERERRREGERERERAGALHPARSCRFASYGTYLCGTRAGDMCMTCPGQRPPCPRAEEALLPQLVDADHLCRHALGRARVLQGKVPRRFREGSEEAPRRPRGRVHDGSARAP